MKIKLLSSITLLLFHFCFGQNSIEDAWVYFKDKPDSATYLASPIKMLSQRAIDRRTRYQIPFDNKDVPIFSNYIQQISASQGITIKAKSKWLNALHIFGTAAAINQLKSLNFVEKIDFADASLNTNSKGISKSKIKSVAKTLDFTTDFNYGNTSNQVEMLGTEVLHQYNFTGSNIEIAILDAGFPNVNQFDAFKRIRDNNQILGGYNFVNRNNNFYTGHYHGMAVLSTIAGYVENEFVGTAPDAKFYLFITEDSTQETPLEESLWVEAAEKADSLGVDIINTSLGYTTFDNQNYNYSYEDMNGKTTFISRGAAIAFTRGMLLVNAAGNEGNSNWHYISAPADVPNVLTVGAVDQNKTIANFSSYGPNSEGIVKPDVLAQGANSYIISTSGNMATSNGTSFASPIMAGSVACLWEAFPNKSNSELIQLIRESSSLYQNPTAQSGYGIPDLSSIYYKLKAEAEQNEMKPTIYPNPVRNDIHFNFPNTTETINFTILNLLGKKIISGTVQKNKPDYSVSQLPKGLYMMQLSYNKTVSTIKILKN
ncbi:MAG: S8 family serine peptidase [Lutibacter sp.]